MIEADLITWEAEYEDGSKHTEVLGDRYRQIRRELLLTFRLVRGSETLVEIMPPDGGSGRNLVYRRRTALNDHGGRRVVFLVGWAPMGPWLVLDPATNEYRTADRLGPGDPDFAPVVFAAEEGEQFLMDLPRTRQ